MLIKSSEQEYLAEEDTVSWLLSALFDKSVTAFYHSSERFNVQRNWIVIGLSLEQQHKQLAFDFAALEPRIIYSDVLNLCEHFSRKRYALKLKLRSNFINISPRLEQSYFLKSANGHNLGLVRVADSCSTQLTSPISFVGPQSYLQKTHRVKLRLRSCLQGAGDCKVLTYGVLCCAKRSWNIQLRADNGRILVDILNNEKGANMQDNQYLGMSVDLGTLELSLEELLRMRPGTTLEFERPKQFEVALKVGEATWAKADLLIEDNKIVIRTKEIVGVTN